MSFQFSSVAIITSTYYPKWYRGRLRSINHTDKVRGDLALEFLKIAKNSGCRVVVSDGKSSKSFKKELMNLTGIKVMYRRTAKRSPAKRQALKFASKINGVVVLISTEPEKISILKDCLEQIVGPILKGEAEIVMPKRESQLFKKTYPDYMHESEIEANELYNEVLRSNGILAKEDKDFDWFFGPRVLANDPKVLRLFMKRYRVKVGNISLPESYFDVEEYSNTSYFPVVVAIKKGLKVKNVEVPFEYPALQKENEEKGARELFIEKRKSQRLALLAELFHFVNSL